MSSPSASCGWTRRDGCSTRPPALIKELGDVRSQLFQYEVRTTYDSPEVAEHRRIVGEAGPGWTPEDDDDEEEEWQGPEKSH